MPYAILKRGMDIAVSAAGLTILSPLLILLAVLIRLDSPGPALFRQERVGKGGTLFNIFKFRSMVQNAPSLGPHQTATNDPRITRTGRYLRAASLDELPQLLNVLLGEMSLVGPRPELPIQQSAYTPENWALRHRVRPGITGLAQVNGRSAVSNKTQMAYDLAYAKQPTLAMDLQILWKTLLLVLKRTGVN